MVLDPDLKGLRILLPYRYDLVIPWDGFSTRPSILNFAGSV